MEKVKNFFKFQKNQQSQIRTRGKDNNCKKLELYGSSLCTTFDLSRISTTLLYLMFFSPNLYSKLVKILLLKAWIFKQNLNSNTKFKF